MASECLMKNTRSRFIKQNNRDATLLFPVRFINSANSGMQVRVALPGLVATEGGTLVRMEQSGWRPDQEANYYYSVK